MQTQMTERDKRLIVMLSLIVIIVGFGWWGIRPALKSTKNVNKEYAQQKDLQEINELKLSQLSIFQVEAERYDELVKEEQKNFYPIMSSSEIDKHFTDMALSHHLNAYDLSINIGKTPADVNPYQYSKLADQVATAAVELALSEQQAEDDLDLPTNNKNKNQDTVSTEEEEDPFSYIPSIAYNSEIYGVDIAMRLSGDREDLQAMIDEISHSEKKSLVRNFVWSEETSMISAPEPTPSAEDADSDEPGLPAATMRVTAVLNINLTLYMCDTSDPVTQTETTEEE